MIIFRNFGSDAFDSNCALRRIIRLVRAPPPYFIFRPKTFPLSFSFSPFRNVLTQIFLRVRAAFLGHRVSI